MPPDETLGTTRWLATVVGTADFERPSYFM